MSADFAPGDKVVGKIANRNEVEVLAFSHDGEFFWGKDPGQPVYGTYITSKWKKAEAELKVGQAWSHQGDGRSPVKIFDIIVYRNVQYIVYGASEPWSVTEATSFSSYYKFFEG